MECVHMANLLGCFHKEWPSEYLGLPLEVHQGKKKFGIQFWIDAKDN